MKRLHNLRPPKGARRDPKRIARGNGTGKGGKGQTMRTGKGKPGPGFEGGQMPMYRRLPKRGFVNIFALRCYELNLDILARHFGPNSVIDLDILKAMGLAGGRTEALRILGRGELTHAITVRGAHVTAGARAKIEAAGGKVESDTHVAAS